MIRRKKLVIVKKVITIYYQHSLQIMSVRNVCIRALDVRMERWINAPNAQMDIIWQELNA